MQDNTVTNIPWYRVLNKSQWKIFLASWLGWGLDGVDFVMITYVLTDIAKAFNLSMTEASTLIFATFATRWLGGVIIGSISDKFGRKPGMIFGILLYSIATFLCGVAWNYWSLLVFRMLVGIGMAGEYSAGTTLLLESWPKKYRNIACGFLSSGWALGSLLVASTYMYIVPNFGWRALFFLGILPALLTLWIRFGIKESSEWMEKVLQEKKPEKTSVIKIFTKQYFPIIMVLFSIIFCGFLMNWSIVSLMPTYLQSIGYSKVLIGKIMFIANLGALVGYCLSGFLADRFGTRLILCTSFSISLGFLAIAMFVGKTNDWVLGIIMFLVLFTQMGVTALWPKYITDHFPAEVRSSALGTTYNLGAIGGGLAPIICSLLVGKLSMGWAVAIPSMFWTLMVIGLISLNVPKIVITKLKLQMDN